MGKKAILFTEDNSNLDNLARYLVQNGWELISGGETAEFLEKNSISVSQNLPIIDTMHVQEDFTNIFNLIMSTYIPSNEDFNMLDNNDTDDRETTEKIERNESPYSK